MLKALLEWGPRREIFEVVVGAICEGRTSIIFLGGQVPGSPPKIGGQASLSLHLANSTSLDSEFNRNVNSSLYTSHLAIWSARG